MNKPPLYLRTVFPQPFQAFCRRFIRVLVDWMNSVASKVGYVVSQTFPDCDPLGRKSSRKFMAAPVHSASWQGREHNSGRGGSEAWLINALFDASRALPPEAKPSWGANPLHRPPLCRPWRASDASSLRPTFSERPCPDFGRFQELCPRKSRSPRNCCPRADGGQSEAAACA